MKYEHKGIEIVFDPKNAEFTATVNDVTLTSTSLSGIKSKISKQQAGGFNPFNALGYGYCLSLDPVRIVGIKKPRQASYHRPNEWLLSDGKTTCKVAADTPANRKLIKACLDLSDEKNKVMEEFNKRLHELKAKIEVLVPPA